MAVANCLWPKFQLNLSLFTQVIAPQTQLGYETKKMTGFFQVRLKTASSQAMKTGMYKLWKNLNPIGYAKVSLDLLTPSMGNKKPAGTKHRFRLI